MVTNLINVNKLQFKTFPGGELHITDEWLRQTNFCEVDGVLCRIQNCDDFFKLCLFTNAYESFYLKQPKTLVLPYVPYARQDRIANVGEALSIKVFASLLNSLNYEEVVILDPHSDVCTALIDNVRILPQWFIFDDKFTESVDLIAPDSGALKKIYRLQTQLQQRNIDVFVRTATKHRDTQTGYITDTTLDGKAQNKTCVVVDDICDGGGTFVALGKKLKKQYKNRILMITHGIFSKGLQELSKYYTQIITTDSFTCNLPPQDNVKIITIAELL
jgi:ribose-phosphate pyrophosphokinase